MVLNTHIYHSVFVRLILLQVAPTVIFTPAILCTTTYSPNTFLELYGQTDVYANI